MGTASFLDRLRGTGPLRPERAREHGALGPVGKASGFSDDARRTRPYDAYPALGLRRRAPSDPDGDALARLRVRWDEVAPVVPPAPPGRRRARRGRRRPARGPSATPATGGPSAGPRRRRARSSTTSGWRTGGHPLPPRSASFHNLVLFHEVFAGDILTDFPFIEASFGLSVAGVAL